jgi:DNA-binding NtrC family response regulator
MASAPADTSAASDEERWCLTVLHTGDAKLSDRIVPIGKGIRIGRSGGDDLDLAIDDRLLSRCHASIEPTAAGDVFELVDHDSRNGSFVDGLRVQRVKLAPGAIIRLGVTVFELTADDREVMPTVRMGLRDGLVGRSSLFVAVAEELQRAAAGERPVVLVGEAGTGKSLAAAEIHRMSGREGALAVVGCRGAGSPLTADDLIGVSEGEERDVSSGFFDSADGGTLVLEEVDLLVPELQELLLAALETGSFVPLGGQPRPFRVRIVASTSANLNAAVAVGAFSQTLHDKLGKRVIELPALRQRRSDIPLLARHFLELEEPGRRFEWSATFLERLLLYDWPGNGRELRTVMRRLTMVEEEVCTLRSAHLPKEIRRGVRLKSEDALRASAISYHAVPSREELRQMLERYHGDVQRIAEHYAKDRRHVYRWLLRHDLSAQEYRK